MLDTCKAKKEHHEFKASLGNKEKFCLKTKQNNNKDKNKWCKDVAVICKMHLSAEVSEHREEFRRQKIHILCFTSKRNQRSCEAYKVTVAKARLENRVLCLLPVSSSNSVGPRSQQTWSQMAASVPHWQMVPQLLRHLRLSGGSGSSVLGWEGSGQA